MSKYATIALSGLSGLILVTASLLAPGTAQVSPAFAFPSTSFVSSTSSSAPPVSSEQPPNTEPDPAGGPTPDDQNMAKQAQENPKMLIACRPSQTAPDLNFRNIGNQVVKAGTTIYWEVPTTGEHGTYTVPKDIAPGYEFPESGAIAAALGKDGSCLSKIQ